MTQPLEAFSTETARLQRQPQLAPQPPGHWFFGHLLQFRRDVLGVLHHAANDGHAVLRYRLGAKLVHLVNSTAALRYVLQENYQNYPKGQFSTSKIRAISGEGLLTSNGDFWLQQRRMLQPAFHRERVASFAATMTDATAELLNDWQTGQPLLMDREMMMLTLTIVGRTLFSADVRQDIATVEQHLTIAMDHCYRRMGRLIDWPPHWPTPGNRRFQSALAALNQVVYRLIQDRRLSGVDNGDLLSLLLRLRDETSGSGLTDDQVRNEAITMLMAGHETAANALMWTLFLLARHPTVEAKLHTEVDEVLQGAVPTLAAVPQLQYTTMVLKEAMRLYPPIWIIERTAVADDEIEGCHIPARTMVVASPYALHRVPKYWKDPERFLPERFADEREIAHFSYLPFGGGPHICIGNNFAMLEAQLVLAMIAQRFRLRLLSARPVTPKPGVTLRLQGGLPMKLERRRL